jgi:hypothetical protein
MTDRTERKLFTPPQSLPSEDKAILTAQIEKQMAAFLKSGGVVQTIPDGVSTTKIMGIKEASAKKAEQMLGTTNYVSGHARKPRKASHIVLNKRRIRVESYD